MSEANNMSKEAMKLALEALENSGTDMHDIAQYQFEIRAIKALEEALASEQEQRSDSEHTGEQDNYQGSDAAKAAHMLDLYTALGVKWGEDPFAVIAKMRSIAETEKQERPTGPATSADRYFYDAGFEAGRLAGIKITLDEWAKSEPPVLAKQEQGEPKQEEYLSKAYRLANELRCHLAIAPAPQQRKPLTDELILALWENTYVQRGRTGIEFARAIEAAHGIKEKNT
jgi:hypothetical protein